MMKRLLIVMLLVLDAMALDIVQAYRAGDIEGIKRVLDAQLSSKKYWDNYLKSRDLKYGYYEDINHVIVTNKSTKLFQIYDYKNNKFVLQSKTNAILGGASGDKERSGDLKTPLGVYDLVGKRKNLDQKYGPMAFVTNYPNLYDTLNGKSGYGIWIHGLPFDGKDKESTQGCVALDNDYITDLENKFDYSKTIVLIHEDKTLNQANEDYAVVISSFFGWLAAWKQNDVNKYLSYYSKDFKRFDGSGIAQFRAFKERVFAKDEEKTIVAKSLNITPYPSLKKEKLFRISFYEEYSAPSMVFNGNKELYVRLENNEFKIIVEK